MTSTESQRTILRASSIIGASSVVGVLFGLVRTKVAAELLGPSGVGLIGIYRNLITTASAIAAVGFATAGVRSLADANAAHDQTALALAWWALRVGTIALACIGSGVFWLASSTISRLVLGSAQYGQELRWLALGIFLTVIAGSQTAKLNGFRRVGDIARVNIVAALCATVVAIGAVVIFRRDGVAAFVLAAPLCTCAVSYVFARGIRVERTEAIGFRSILWHWGALARVGVGVMVAGIAATGGALVIRTIIQRNLGSASLGQFQAAWAVSMTYVEYVLVAMSIDYFPRLAGIVTDKSAANKLINEQLEVALLVGGPIIAGMLALAPWVITLLYSNRFGPAVTIIRWQVYGDVFKVASFPLAYLMLATSATGLYIGAELVFMAVVVCVTWFGIPRAGLVMTGVALLVAYVVYFLSSYCVARRLTAFRFTRRSVALLVLLLVVGGSELLVTTLRVPGGTVLAIVMAAMIAAYCALRIVQLAATGEIEGNRILAAVRRLSRHDGQ